MAFNKQKTLAAAQKHASKGNYEKTILEYKKILENDPGDIRIWLKMGDIYTRMGARRDATRTYLKVAGRYKKKGFHLKAVALYKQIVSLDPLMIDGYWLLGESYLKMGQEPEALIQFEKVVEVAVKQNKSNDVVKALEKILSLDGENVGAMLKLGEQHAADGHDDEAVQWLRKACDTLDEQGRIEDYLKVSERLLYYSPEQIEIAQKAAGYYLGISQPKRALAKLQVCFSKDNKDEVTLELLARAFLALGQRGKAVSVYQELIPVLKSKRNSDKLTEVCNRVLELDPQNTVAQSHVNIDGTGGGKKPREGADVIVARMLEEIDVLVKYGKEERAKEHFDRIFVLDYYNLDAREKLKDLMFAGGDIPGAKEQLFILVEAFEKTDPNAAVYYLHEILKMDAYSKRARQIIADIGGVLPEGLPELDPSKSTLDSGLIMIDDVDVDSGLKDDSDESGDGLNIDDIPYVEEVDPDFVEDVDDADFEELPSPASAPSVESSPPPSPSGMPLPKPSLAPPRPGPGPSLPPPPRPSMPPTSSSLPKPSIPPLFADSPVVGNPLDDDNALGERALDASPLVEDNEDNDVIIGETSESFELNVSDDDGELANVPESDELAEEIEEVEFFVEQGLEEEGLKIFKTLLENYPNDGRLLALQSKFQNIEENLVEEDITTSQSFELNELSRQLNLQDVSEDQQQVAVDEVFSQFKKGVSEQVSSADYATHFDLGQAYKEMGLWDDAIGEFRLAAGHVDYKVKSEMMMGMCHLGAGRFDESVEVYDEILGFSDLAESERLGAAYEKAKVFQLMGQNDEALELFNDILLEDPGFADVVERIDELEDA